MRRELHRITTVASVLAALIAAGAVLSVGRALALDEPQAGRKDKRVRFVDFDPHNIVRVSVAMRTSFLIVFAKDETIRDIGGGNTVAWEVAPSSNILFLKPRENHPPTNLQVVTARSDGTARVYQLELSSVAGEQKGDAYLSLEYRYPTDEARAAHEQARQQAAKEEGQAASRQLARHEAHGPRNYAYTAQGSSLIEPAEVFDNGKLTSFRFVGQQETPAIYLVGQDGREQLVPKNVVGELTQVHAYAAKFVLRLGREVLCVSNENYLPGGLSTGTMTTSPAVERVIAKPQSVKARALPPLRSERPAGPARMMSSRSAPAEGSLGPVPVPGSGVGVARVIVPAPKSAPPQSSGGIDVDRIVIRPQAAQQAPAVQQIEPRIIPASGGEASQRFGDDIIVRGAATPVTDDARSVALAIARENFRNSGGVDQIAANQEAKR